MRCRVYNCMTRRRRIVAALVSALLLLCALPAVA